MTDPFRIEHANKVKASADELRAIAMAGNNASALEWAGKAEFIADEAIRAYQSDDLAAGDELFRGASTALERASAALAA